MDRFRSEHGDLGVICCDSPDQVAADSDALILATEWPAYRDLKWEEIAGRMRSAIVLDTRNALDRERLIRSGFRYLTIAGLDGSADAFFRAAVPDRDMIEAESAWTTAATTTLRA